MYSAAGSVLWQILALISLPILIKTVGTADFGIFSLAAASIGYFSILSLPARQAVMKFVAQYGEESKEKVGQIFNSAFILNVLTGIAVSLMLAGLALNAAELFDLETEHLEKAEMLLYVYALSAIIIHPMSVFGSLLYGYQRYGSVAIIDGVGAITRFSMILLIYAFDGSIFWYVAHEIAFEISKNLILARIAIKEFGSKYLRLHVVEWRSLKSILEFGGWSAMYALSLIILTQGNKVLVGMVLSVSMVTYLHVAYMLYNLVNTAASYLRAAVLPSSSSALAAGDDAFISRLVHSGTTMSVAVILAICVNMLVFLEDILRVWMGSEFVDNALGVSRLLVFSWVFIAPTFLLTHVYWGQKDIGPVSKVALTGALLQIPLLLWLAGRIGLEAAGWASVVFFAFQLPFHLKIILTKLKVDIGGFLLRALLPAYLVSAVLAVVVYIGRQQLDIQPNLMGVIFMFVLSVSVCTAITLLMVSRSESLVLLRRIITGIRRPNRTV